MDNDKDDGISFSDYPFAWIIIPIFVFFFVGLCMTILRFRRRRRRATQYQQWPGTTGRVVGPGGHIVVVSRRGGASRWNPWQTTRSQEGLNELGEAPPPYEGKKNGQQGNELRDLESGERPPEYPAAPGPAVTTESRRFAQR